MFGKIPLTVQAALIASEIFALALLGMLLLQKQQDLLLDLVTSRVAVLADNIERTAHTGFENSLSLGETRSLQNMLHDLQQISPGMVGAHLYSLESSDAPILFDLDVHRIGETADPDDIARTRHGPTPWRIRAEDGRIRVGGRIDDDSGRVRGGYVFILDGTLYDIGVSGARDAFLPALFAALPLAAILTLGLLRFAENLPWPHFRLRATLLTVSMVVTLACGSIMAWQAKRIFASHLQPALTAKAGTVAVFLERKIQHAVMLGIPLHRIAGIGDYFTEVVDRHAELSGIHLTDDHGQFLASVSRPAKGIPTAWLDVCADCPSPADRAYLQVDIDPGFMTHRLWTLAADLGIVLLAAMILFNEIANAALARIGSGIPTEDLSGAARQQRLAAIRLPLFLFILSEELTRAFLPLHIQNLAAAGLYTSASLGIPITLYMVCFALMTLFAGNLSDRFGSGRIFTAGAILSTAGFALAALTSDFWMFTLARALCGSGYALATMACQREILADTDASTRAQGLALLIGSVGIAAICGASFGGMLAERTGFRFVFLLSALTGIVSLILFLRLFRGIPHPATADRTPIWHDLRSLSRRPRFVLLMVCGAIPVKIVLAGFLFFLVPIALASYGFSPGGIGRSVMLYFILLSLLTSWVSRLSDHHRMRWVPVIAGGLIVAGGILAGSLPGRPEYWTLCAIGSLGIGTALSAPAMQALANEIGSAPPHGVSPVNIAVAFRTVERVGSALGPVFVAGLLGLSGIGGAMAGTGLMMLTATLLLMLLALGSDHARTRRTA